MTTTNDLATTLTTADSDMTTMTMTLTPFVADRGFDDDNDESTTETATTIGLANSRVAAKELAAIRRVLEPQNPPVAAKELAAIRRVLEPQIPKTKFGENRWRELERPTDESSIKAPS